MLFSTAVSHAPGDVHCHNLILIETVNNRLFKIRCQGRIKCWICRKTKKVSSIILCKTCNTLSMIRTLHQKARRSWKTCHASYSLSRLMSTRNTEKKNIHLYTCISENIGWAEYIGCPPNVIVGWAAAHPAAYVPAPYRFILLPTLNVVGKHRSSASVVIPVRPVLRHWHYFYKDYVYLLLYGTSISVGL